MILCLYGFQFPKSELDARKCNAWFFERVVGLDVLYVPLAQRLSEVRVILDGPTASHC